MRPLLNRIIVEPLKENETTPSGIVVPGGARGETATSKVIAVGSGNRAADGTPIEMDIKVGDTVYFSPLSLAEITVNGKKYGLLKYPEVIMVLEGDEVTEGEGASA